MRLLSYNLPFIVFILYNLKEQNNQVLQTYTKNNKMVMITKIPKIFLNKRKLYSMIIILVILLSFKTHSRIEDHPKLDYNSTYNFIDDLSENMDRNSYFVGGVSVACFDSDDSL